MIEPGQGLYKYADLYQSREVVRSGAVVEKRKLLGIDLVKLKKPCQDLRCAWDQSCVREGSCPSKQSYSRPTSCARS